MLSPIVHQCVHGCYQCREGPDILVKEKLQIVSSQICQSSNHSQEEAQQERPCVVGRANDADLRNRYTCVIGKLKFWLYRHGKHTEMMMNVLPLPAHQSCLPPIWPAAQLQSLGPAAHRYQTCEVSLGMGSGGRSEQNSYRAATQTQRQDSGTVRYITNTLHYFIHLHVLKLITLKQPLNICSGNQTLGFITCINLLWQQKHHTSADCSSGSGASFRNVVYAQKMVYASFWARFVQRRCTHSWLTGRTSFCESSPICAIPAFGILSFLSEEPLH